MNYLLLNDSNPDIFAFHYNFVMNISDVAKKIRVRNVMPKKIIFAVNVGKRNESTYVGNTKVEGKVVRGCHFSMGVYYTEENQLVYGDSLGWPIPDSVIQTFNQLLSLLFGVHISKATAFSYCHSPQENQSGHSCFKGCWKHYPLQTCTHICGVSAIVSMCLAASADKSFLSLKGSPEQVDMGYNYLKKISYYSDFVRLIVMQWLLNSEIDVSALRCSNVFTDNGNSKPFEKCIDASNDVGVEHLANNIGVEHLPNNETSIPNCALELNDLSTPSCVKDSRVSLFVEACESLGSKQCNLPGTHYHCSLCPPGKQFPSLYRINRHIEQAHVNPARCLDFGGFRILPCKKEHDDIKYSKCNYHYHCPICNKTIMHKTRFEHHIALHMRKMDLTKSTSRPAGSDTSGGTLGNTELKSNAEAFNDKEPMPTESNSMTITDIDEAADIKEMCESVPTASNLKLNRVVNPVVTCHHCGKSMLKKDLRRHSVTAHNYITFTAVCCDQELGLYMVRRNQQGGIGFPVHVQKILCMCKPWQAQIRPCNSRNPPPSYTASIVNRTRCPSTFLMPKHLIYMHQNFRILDFL